MSVACAAAYVFYTPRGSAFLVKKALAKYLPAQTFTIGKSEGSFARTLVLSDLEFHGLSGLPAGSVLKVQSLKVHIASFEPAGRMARIDNGRLQLPDSELILFRGRLQNNALDANIFSNGLRLEQLSGFVPGNAGLKQLSGAISGIDIYVKGALSKPQVSGKCRVERFLRGGFTLADSLIFFDIRLEGLGASPKVFGTVSTDSGTVSGPRTAVIALSNSKVSFSGDPSKPELDLRGVSAVESVKINIAVKGTLDKPELILASDPPLPRERLAVMLLTNKSWKATQAALGSGQLSPDVARDFIGYFLFPASGNSLAKRLGLTDISFTFDRQQKGVGVNKAITGNLSVEAEKELLPQAASGQSGPPQRPSDNVLLKFKKKF